MKSAVTQCVLAAISVFKSFIAYAEVDTYQANLSTLIGVTTNTEDTENTRSPVLGLQVFFKPVNINYFDICEHIMNKKCSKFNFYF
jgi:hypothetical protein